jgi:hypothetical protein
VRHSQFFQILFLKKLRNFVPERALPFRCRWQLSRKNKRKNEQRKLFKRKHRTSRAASQDIHVLLTLPGFPFRKNQESFLKKWVNAEKKCGIGK